MKNETKHTQGYKKGDKVLIFNRTMGGELFVEGVATLVSPVPDFGGDIRTTWMVRFRGDSTPYRRQLWDKSDFTKEEYTSAMKRFTGGK